MQVEINTPFPRSLKDSLDRLKAMVQTNLLFDPQVKELLMSILRILFDRKMMDTLKSFALVPNPQRKIHCFELVCMFGDFDFLLLLLSVDELHQLVDTRLFEKICKYSSYPANSGKIKKVIEKLQHIIPPATFAISAEREFIEAVYVNNYHLAIVLIDIPGVKPLSFNTIACILMYRQNSMMLFQCLLNSGIYFFTLA